MNKRKIFVLLIVLFTFLGLSLAAVSAASTSIKLKNGDVGYKIIGKGNAKDVLEGFYFKNKKSIEIHLLNVISSKAPNYKMSKVKVYYKNSKKKVITKTYKVSNGKKLLKKNPKGYTPYKAIVYYAKKKK